ncbi:MAG: GntR family transcriptional regulator [Egibacteraceae bacterium]
MYQQVADELRREILSGRLQPGQQLPSENELVARHRTTRSTVRKAIAQIRSEGLAITKQGKGAFVRTRPTIQMIATSANYLDRRSSGISNFNAEVAAQGHRAEQLVQEVAAISAPPEIAERLALDADEHVLVRRRLFLVDDHPMKTVDSYYPLTLVQGTSIERPGRIRGGVHAALERERGVVIRRLVEELDARMPTPDETDQLAIPPGVPVVHTWRTAYDSEGRPVALDTELSPADRYIFRFVIDIS